MEVAAPPSTAEAKLEELILDALKRALADTGPQRLFRSGKLAGLFPTRTGASADAALKALTEELLETVRTETKGKVIIEWVRLTPRGVRYIHERDSAKAVLRELRELLGETRLGVPDWMQAARTAALSLATQFEQQGQELLKRLDHLTQRVEAALRRVEASGPKLSDQLTERYPWCLTALEYLDKRLAAGAMTPCPLAELFTAMQLDWPDLNLGDFQNGLLRLCDSQACRLLADGPLENPEHAILQGQQLCNAITRE